MSKDNYTCSIHEVIVCGRNKLLVIKSTWSSVELNLFCVQLIWLNPDVSLTVKHYNTEHILKVKWKPLSLLVKVKSAYEPGGASGRSISRFQ